MAPVNRIGVRCVVLPKTVTDHFPWVNVMKTLNRWFLGFVWCALVIDAQASEPASAGEYGQLYEASTYGLEASVSMTGSAVSAVAAVASVPMQDSTEKAWRAIGAAYVDGSQPVLTSPPAGVGKYIVTDGAYQPVDFLPLDRHRGDGDGGILVLGNGLAVVTEQKNDQFVLVGDAYVDPQAPLVVMKEIRVNRDWHGQLTSHFSLAPDGHLIALTQTNRLIAVDLDRGLVVASVDLPSCDGRLFRQAFAMDAAGRIYLSAADQAAVVDWRDGGFRLAATAHCAAS